MWMAEACCEHAWVGQRLALRPCEYRGHLEKPAAQIFVRLPGGLVLELEAPTSQAVTGSRDYHALSEQGTPLFRDVGSRADE